MVHDVPSLSRRVAAALSAAFCTMLSPMIQILARPGMTNEISHRQYLGAPSTINDVGEQANSPHS